MGDQLTNKVLHTIYSYLGMFIIIVLIIFFMWLLKPKRLRRWCLQSWKYIFNNCWIHFSCKKSRHLSIEDIIDRFQKDIPDHKHLKSFFEQEKTVRKILDIINVSIPDFQFSIMPTGSIREGYGKLLPSTSCLASDFDFMVIPEDCYVDLCASNVGQMEKIDPNGSDSIQITINSSTTDQMENETGSSNDSSVNQRLQNVLQHGVDIETKCIFEAHKPNGVKDMFCWLALKSDLPKRHKHWSNNIIYKKIDQVDKKVLSNDKIKQKVLKALQKAKAGLESHFTEIDENDREGKSFSFHADIKINGPAVTVLMKRTEMLSCDEFCHKLCPADWAFMKCCCHCFCCCCLFHKTRQDTMKTKKKKHRDGMAVFEGDITLAIPCKGWPNETKGWFERRRSWPAPGVINTIKAGGIHVVPKPSSHSSAISFITVQPERETFFDDKTMAGGIGCEFRFSFSHAEVILADCAPQKAKESFRVFRSTIKRLQAAIDDEDELTYKIDSYAMKAIFYRSLEEQKLRYWEQPNEANLRGDFLMNLFQEKDTSQDIDVKNQKLNDALQHRNLPHYWLGNNLNLFSHFNASSDDSIEIRNKKKSDYERLRNKLLGVPINPHEYIIDDWVEHNRCIMNHCCFCSPPDVERARTRGFCNPITIPYRVSETGMCGPCPEFPENNDLFAVY